MKGLGEIALGEGECCRGHSATRARQIGSLLESAVAEMSAQVDLEVPNQCEGDEVHQNRQADDCRYEPLAN